ncbi:MAG: hypothetical protein MUF13_05560 [Akkermansiaceae bacterium]|jgi:hypothetical protein|nr:hypothetical protein [Akkermansiaceae bacterium]
MKTNLSIRARFASLGSTCAICFLSLASVEIASAQTNTKTGIGAGAKFTTGKNNTADGFRALFATKTGSFNTAVGGSALTANLGSSNVAVGFQALFKNSKGNFNVALGDGALRENRNGKGNIGIGEDGGFNITGDNNICIGNKGISGQSGVIRIGTPGTHNTTFIAGTISGNGSGLTGVPAASITGAISGAQITNASVSSAKLAPNLTLPGTTVGTFSGNIASSFSSTTNANGSIVMNPFPPLAGTNLLATFTGINGGAQLRFQKSGNTDFMDIGQDANDDFVIEGNDTVHMTVEKDGNVGLGASPNSKLHVNGGTIEPALRVQVAGESKLTVAANGGVTVGEFDNSPPANGLQVAGELTVGGRPAVVGEESLRIVRGSVNSVGGISKGSGFTVTKGSTGLYTINFSTSFASAPSVTATLTGAPGHIVGNLAGGATTTSYQVFVSNTSNSSADIGFDFIAVGPR